MISKQYPFHFFSSNNTSFKDQSAHIAPVKNILENHASYLMSGKELSKLVAFVKGTQFDLVVRKPKLVQYVIFYWVMWFSSVLLSNTLQEYLQRERYGSARLENFASGLELIGQKVRVFLETCFTLYSFLLCCVITYHCEIACVM